MKQVEVQLARKRAGQPLRHGARSRKTAMFALRVR